MLLVIFGIFLFVLLVIVHEWGHFIAARRNGVDVEEFGLGFPPKARTLTRKNGTEYTLNWLPLGGFVRLKGENDSAKGKGTFGSASFGKKTLIIFAGVLMNWLTAMVIFTIISLFGMPQFVDNQFNVERDTQVVKQEVFLAQVQEGSAAAKAGLVDFDVILKIGDKQISKTSELRDATAAYAGQTIDIAYKRDGVTNTTRATLQTDISKGALGVAPADNTLIKSTWSAPIVGVGTTVQLTAETYKGLAKAVGDVFTGQGKEASAQVTGPVGIVVTLQTLADQGLVFVLFLIGVISLSLAVMNSLPIPALDGGRWFVMVLFKVLRKPLSKDLEERIHGTGMAFLLLLVLLITVLDVRRFF